MEIIELERWRPSKDDPRKPEYAGQPIAQEVFEELKYRLEGMGCLPDEYFLLDREWENGREIPRGADVFCTVDYGASEGVYLDVYLKWHDEPQKKSVTSGFITGKTLGENGNDLHMLTYEGRNSWMAESLLQKRMWVDINDYGALNACVQNGAVDVAKLLLDGGMDFERYREAYPNSGSAETVQALEEHWNELQAQMQEQEQDDAPQMGGMTFG